MLEKSLKNITFFDSHFHLSDFKILPDNWCGCTCAHSKTEWEIQSNFFKDKSNGILAFGIHPEQIGKIDIKCELDFLEQLIQDPNSKLKAIGEIGFDFYTSEYLETKIEQENTWNQVLDLAIFYNFPIIVHCRKANHKLFEYSSGLKKVPSVLFHSFMGSTVEANSLISRDINCFFSFGKQIMNNNKKVISLVQNLPINNLLLETDAPFQTLKGQTRTELSEIKLIYENAWNLRLQKNVQRAFSFLDFSFNIEQNFIKMFNKPVT